MFVVVHALFASGEGSRIIDCGLERIGCPPVINVVGSDLFGDRQPVLITHHVLVVAASLRPDEPRATQRGDQITTVDRSKSGHYRANATRTT